MLLFDIIQKLNLILGQYIYLKKNLSKRIKINLKFCNLTKYAYFAV